MVGTILIGLAVWMSIATVIGLLVGRIVYDTNQPELPRRGSNEPHHEEAA